MICQIIGGLDQDLNVTLIVSQFLSIGFDLHLETIIYNGLTILFLDNGLNNENDI